MRKYGLVILFTLSSLSGMENNMMESLNNKTLQLEKIEIKGEKPSFQVSDGYKLEWSSGKLILQIQVLSTTNISVSWRLAYLQKTTHSSLLPRKTNKIKKKGTIGNGCIAALPQQVQFFKEHVWKIGLKLIPVQSHRCLREVFGNSGNLVEGQCIVKNSFGSRLRNFQVLITPHLQDDKPRAYSIQNNFTQDTERNETLIPLNIEDIDELLEEGIEEFEMDKISAFRLEKDRKERKRIREQYKAIWFIVGMIIPMCILLYITLSISCR
ncbi:uncharacterized protein LOC111712965 [Eurytemora carolleeae]|uniref:uncharacterized protein LOC111712965 n=1 Tax=Eurytemora carolleeae TaxID=1294199 RepID=UPI000C7854B2|nr:uncharacterized protein LOC111712965 [Eurytemora carolleeae]|eukprot:XP_023343502.1 uncharacterized protein LOC111712965 [Eurytemora affinis]